MEVEQYNSEIRKICDELVEEGAIFNQLSPVSHLSKSRIQFVGGILGAIREIREEKRLVKLMNAKVCKDWSFYNYAGHLMDVAAKLTELQLNVQKLTTEDDDCYFGNVRLIALDFSIAYEAWYKYSPDMAEAAITIEDEKNVALAPTVNAVIKDEFKKLSLPEDIKISEEEKEKNGCLGVILLILVIGFGLIFI